MFLTFLNLSLDISLRFFLWVLFCWKTDSSFFQRTCDIATLWRHTRHPADFQPKTSRVLPKELFFLSLQNRGNFLFIGIKRWILPPKRVFIQVKQFHALYLLLSSHSFSCVYRMDWNVFRECFPIAARFTTSVQISCLVFLLSFFLINIY